MNSNFQNWMHQQQNIYEKQKQHISMHITQSFRGKAGKKPVLVSLEWMSCV
jgi:hypothetical protein